MKYRIEVELEVHDPELAKELARELLDETGDAALMDKADDPLGVALWELLQSEEVPIECGFEVIVANVSKIEQAA